MAIVTISRELAAMGDECARELAKLLNYRFIDKQSLEERIKSYGLTGALLHKYDERRPGILASLSQERDQYLHYLKSAMLGEAEQGNCIIIGRGANVIFRGLPGMISVFLTAPLEIRMERIKSYFHCDDKKARQIISQSDRNRTGFYSNFFEAEWRAPSNYHLCLNTGIFSPNACAEIIKAILDRSMTGEAETQYRERLAELSLGQAIATHVLYDKGINVHFFEAQVSGGRAELFGVTNSGALVEAAVLAAREVAGSLEILPGIQVVQDFNVVN